MADRSPRLKSRTAVIVSLTHLPSDSRAAFYGRALAGLGFRVVGAGLRPVENSPPPHDNSAFDELIEVSPYNEPRWLRRYGLALSLVAGRTVPALRQASYWAMPERGRLLQALRKRIGEHSVDLVVAKHWTAVPIARRIASATGASLIYDANELSFAEHEENGLWRLLARSHVASIEQSAFRTCARAVTFGKAAASAHRDYYSLTETPAVVRNFPVGDPPCFRAPEEPFSFVYVGLAIPVRNLECLIDSTAFWKPDRRLVLILTGKKDYIGQLRRRADKKGLTGDRVTFREPLTPRALLDVISNFDAGLMMFKTHSRQMQVAEPNKLYQYVSAGLGVLTADLDNPRRLIDQYGFGAYGNAGTPTSIASLVNSLAGEDIARMKRRAVQFSREHNHDRELAALKDVLRAVLKED